jgi:drug/metabolite transporter (DMT)-like permease
MTHLKKWSNWLHPAPLVAVMLWGGIYPGIKLGLRDIPALSFTYLRLLLATGILCAIARRTPRGRHTTGIWKPLLYAGLAQMAFQGLLIAGLARTTAGNSAVLSATAPLLTAGWLVVTSRARLAPRQWAGLLAGLGGVTLVAAGGGAAFSATQISGDLLTIGAAGAWAWYGFAIGPLVGLLGTLRATGWAMGLAALLFTPIALLEVVSQAWNSVSWMAWGGLVYTATAGMVVAMALWGKAVQQFGPRHTMLYVYLEPVAALVIAAVLLGEFFNLVQAGGVLLTLLGVWCASHDEGNEEHHD